MEVEVKEALRALTQEDTRMTAHEVLGLQDRLRIVDEKFAQLRGEISRLNAVLAEEKSRSDVLREKLSAVLDENAELKTRKKAAPTKKPGKKKTTKKKK